ncbi:MAG: HisA/HisF-related TIM barrel protein [Acidobacteriota bacterium]|nr:HisA/HisF-related TIM barrel protein [Acidobacteriota bacterium]
MLIPSIDLKGGKVVQLVQGDRTAIEDPDLDYWIDRFRAFPLVQVIDLDAALGTGSNDAMLARVLEALPCQVGGGIRTSDRARRLIDAGARRVIVGSTLFDGAAVNLAAAGAFARAVGAPALVAAVDCRGGEVMIGGWKTRTGITADDAIRALEPHAGAFLCTLIETEGTMRGIDMAEITRLRALTARGFIAAGGIRSMAEVDALEAIGADAVVGMAIYTGKLAGSV